MAKVIVYTKDHCPYCTLAKNLLSAKQIPFSEIRVDQNAAELEKMISLSNRRTVPQIFINDQPIGGYDDLAALVKSGKLDDLLNS
ncbi:MAG TPA: glutaredoxin 3 [Gammaproteobacteria bacterium]|jgi:glutaredoxin 3|nr:glutaredoxin 3 [Gammaproteobacteria bacterium]